MATPRLALLVSALLLLMGLSGCSGDDTKSGDPSRSGQPSVSSGSASASASPTPASSSNTSTSPSSTGPAPAPQTVNKDVTDNAFPDGTFSLRVGDTVVWTHKGSNLHSVTSNGNFDSHPNCPPVCMLGGQTYTHTFDAAGTFDYRCKIHAAMTGTITVAG